jgi:Cu+-exporting ATPase
VSARGIEAVRFPVEGMTCTACVGRITRHVRKVDGVHGVSVDLRGERVTVRRSTGTAPDSDLAAAIADAGYMADLARAVAVPAQRTRLERLLGR